MNKKDLPIFRISDFSKHDIFVLQLNRLVYPKHLSKKKESDFQLPHRSDYYVFFYVEEGTFSLMVDFDNITVTGPALFYFLPRQVKALLLDNVVSGWSIAISSNLIEEKLEYIFESVIPSPYAVEPPPHIGVYLSECLQILELINMADNAPLNVQKNIALSCVEMIANTYFEPEAGDRHQDNLKFQHTRDFFILLKDNYNRLKSPFEYSRYLNISAAYLNECVRWSTGKSVSYWIQHEIILEAQRILFYTDRSVKDIALELGYEDHAYFSRLFSKNVRVSPKKFRRDTRDFILREPSTLKQYFK